MTGTHLTLPSLVPSTTKYTMTNSVVVPDLAHVPIILFGTTEGDDPSSARGGLPACRQVIQTEAVLYYKSSFQNSCRLSFMHCITTGKGMESFHRIFFRKDFHRMFLVGSYENFSVNSMRTTFTQVPGYFLYSSS